MEVPDAVDLWAHDPHISFGVGALEEHVLRALRVSFASEKSGRKELTSNTIAP